MAEIPLHHVLILAAVLFILGAVGVMVRRNLIFVLMSIEIMLSAAAVAFVGAASKWHQPDGQVFFIFILATAAAEAAVGLSLLLRIYHNWKNIDSDEVDLMKG